MYVCIIFISLTITSNTSIPYFNFIISFISRECLAITILHTSNHVCTYVYVYLCILCVYMYVRMYGMYVHMLVCTYVCKYVGYMYVQLHKQY